MIGGYDCYIFGPVSVPDMDFILRALHEHWPKGTMMVLDPSGGKWPLTNRPRPARLANTFVYRTPEDERSWDRDGQTADNTDGVVLIFPESNCIAFTVSGENSSSGKIVRDIILNLQRHRAKRT